MKNKKEKTNMRNTGLIKISDQGPLDRGLIDEEIMKLLRFDPQEASELYFIKKSQEQVQGDY